MKISSICQEDCWHGFTWQAENKQSWFYEKINQCNALSYFNQRPFRKWQNFPFISNIIAVMQSVTYRKSVSSTRSTMHCTFNHNDSKRGRDVCSLNTEHNTK